MLTARPDAQGPVGNHWDQHRWTPDPSPAAANGRIAKPDRDAAQPAILPAQARALDTEGGGDVREREGKALPGPVVTEGRNTTGGDAVKIAAVASQLPRTDLAGPMGPGLSRRFDHQRVDSAQPPEDESTGTERRSQPGDGGPLPERSAPSNIFGRSEGQPSFSPIQTAAPAADVRPEPAGLRVPEAVATVGMDPLMAADEDMAADGAEMEKSARSDRGGILDQIVFRAAYRLRNGQSQLRLDLKPEFLGNLRMQISTRKQMVTLKILAEHPLAKEVIETHLHQLKTDLLQQGLEVDDIEVALGDDFRQLEKQFSGADDGDADGFDNQADTPQGTDMIPPPAPLRASTDAAGGVDTYA
jgi:hypothetical protein